MRKYALCIGINEYPGTDMDLAGCVNDAHDWCAELSYRGYQSTLLLDEIATGEIIRREIVHVISQARWGDRVIVTYSGHGTWVPDPEGDEADRRDEALCPHDVMTSGPLVDDELFALFAGRRFGVRVVFISDSCHSGSVSRFAPSSAIPRVLDPRQLPEPVIPPDMSTFKTAPLLFAGASDFEYAYDTVIDDRPCGAFTNAALRVLSGLGPKTTYAQWHEAVRAHLPNASHPQTPQLDGSSGQKRWAALS